MNVSLNPNYQSTTNFNGSMRKTEQGNPYFKTNAGTTAGLILAVPAFAFNSIDNKSSSPDNYTKQIEEARKQLEIAKEAGLNDEEIVKTREAFKKMFGMDPFNAQENEKFIQELEKLSKSNKKYKFINAFVAAVLTLGCGIIVDKLRNDKAVAVADEIKQKGVQRASYENSNIRMAEYNKPYFHSNEGKKWGALLGAGCAGIMTLLANIKANGNPITKKILNNKVGTSIKIANAIIMALGGFLIGAVTDTITNNNAKKHV